MLKIYFISTLTTYARKHGPPQREMEVKSRLLTLPYYPTI
jgi:hypothetical protein